ncbi:MAG TPA: NTP transferase domain-containing protein, partial [Amaricoccus sp.]|uniref:NTP transferase domain-containing protein n=1 Tax=Amaricoccus sp. TaxID=1872485 RepID=UPI002BD61F3C
IGPNGAGKSTTFNCISRYYRPSSGSIRFDGADITRKKPHEMAALGVARTFQNLELFGALSVRENALLGTYAHGADSAGKRLRPAFAYWGWRGVADAAEDEAAVLRAVAETAKASRVDQVLVVLPPAAAARRAALDGLAVGIVEAPDWAEGMAASIRAGLAAVRDEIDAVVILLADMPEVAPGDIDRLIAAFDTEAGREICRAVSADGRPGHPVLFGRRFFEALAGLEGDRGAREVIRTAEEFVTEVPTGGRSAVVDLDTPEDWAAWRAAAAEQ